MIKLTDEDRAKYTPKKKQTNLEKIRAMSVGEFIGMFGHNDLCDYIQYQFKSHCEAHGVCGDCLKEWLLKEVEE